MSYLLHNDFIKAAHQNPYNKAVIMEDERSISYEELDELSNKFAHFLLNKKAIIKERPYVGILSPVHIESIAAVLGSLKVGCAYVPLDDQSPSQRLKYIIDKTHLDTIVVDANLYFKFKDLLTESASIKHIILLSNIDERLPAEVTTLEQITNMPGKIFMYPNQVSDDLAYILHTSGSTGTPKGIMLTHRNARTFVDWMQKEFSLTSEDRVMSRAPFKFDLSVFDIFNTFKVGATLICYDWNMKRSEEDRHVSYSKLMADQKATILYTTPSTFISLMNRGKLDTFNLSLKKVMYAGEPFPVPQLVKLKEILKKARIANIYGPTETNIITYYWIDNISKELKAVPLGQEVDDTEILVINTEEMKICSPNEIGELWCRGGTVTLGYLGRPDLTREHLVDSPFHNYPAKFWRTGDYGYRDEQGVLHYRGRKDHMVKVKGYRIEIGEIESVLSRHPALDEFVVIAILDEKYGNKLVCFFSTLSNELLTETELKGFLGQNLPDYMIPFCFQKMTVLPKTTSGKVDRVLLAEKAKKIFSN